MIGVRYKFLCRYRVQDSFSYFRLTLVRKTNIPSKTRERKEEKKKKKKETHTVWFVNYSHLRIVNKIIIFGRNCLNILSVIDKYLGLQYSMQNVLFFNCMFFT